MPARKAWAALPYNPRPGDGPVLHTKIHHGVIHKQGVEEKKAMQI